MQSDTGFNYDYQDIVMPLNEELIFLRTYMMAIKRVRGELKLAVCNISYI